MTEGNPSSAGWATFEARMRTRRFARCIERATIGLEAGTLEDVRDALDEARVLCPDAPEIAELEARIAALPSPGATFIALDAPRQEPPAGWLRVAGAMGVLLVLFGLFGFGLTHLYLTGPARTLLSSETAKTSSDGNTPMAPADPDVLASAAATSGSGAAPGPAAGNPTEPVGDTLPGPAVATPLPADPPNGTITSPEATPPVEATPTIAPVPAPSANATGSRDRDQDRLRPEVPTDRPAAARRAAADSVESPRRERPSSDTANAANRVGIPPRLTVRRDSPATEAPPSAATPPPPPPPVVSAPSAPAPATETRERPAAAEVVPAPAAPAPAAAVPAANTSAAADMPVPAVRANAASSRAEEAAQIRSVLSRYETAYNRLDASAATSVWPNVDQAALDRAFKGLISQRVSLGLCDITVIGDVGGASCAGKARWEPRVGGGLQTADRHWTFNLRKNQDGGWHIEQIRVR